MKKEVALEEEVNSGSGRETQERAGAGEGVVRPVFKEEEVATDVRSTLREEVYTWEKV